MVKLFFCLFQFWWRGMIKKLEEQTAAKDKCRISRVIIQQRSSWSDRDKSSDTTIVVETINPLLVVEAICIYVGVFVFLPVFAAPFAGRGNFHHGFILINGLWWGEKKLHYSINNAARRKRAKDAVDNLLHRQEVKTTKGQMLQIFGHLFQLKSGNVQSGIRLNWKLYQSL